MVSSSKGVPSSLVPLKWFTAATPAEEPMDESPKIPDPLLSVAQLYTLYAGNLQRYLAFKKRLAPPDIDDIVQEVFIRTHHLGLKEHGRPGYNPGPLSAKSWLFRLLVQVLYERHRLAGRDARLLGDDRLGEMVEKLADKQRREDIQRICECVWPHLNEHERDLFLFYYFEGLTQDEIASVLSAPPGTVGPQLARLAQRLHKLFWEQESNQP